MTISMPDCNSPHTLSAAAGGVTALLGLDRALPLPPGVHYMAAGLLSKSYCTGWAMPSADRETAMCVAAAVASGIMVRSFF
jgi:hypothetical protein